MALPATDAFTDSDDTTLEDHNASWTVVDGGFKITSNSLQATDTGASGAGWNADAFNADQYAEATVVAVTTSHWVGVAVRVDVSTPDDYYYGFIGRSSDSFLFKVINGSWTQIGSAGGGFSVSDVVRVEISGTDPGTLTPYINDVEEDPPGAQTDSDLDAGAAGPSAYAFNSGARIDDWEGGNLGAAGPLSVSEAEALVATVGPTTRLGVGIAVSDDNVSYWRNGPVVVGSS